MQYDSRAAEWQPASDGPAAIWSLVITAAVEQVSDRLTPVRPGLHWPAEWFAESVDALAHSNPTDFALAHRCGPEDSPRLVVAVEAEAAEAQLTQVVAAGSRRSTGQKSSSNQMLIPA